jgi:membrane protein
VKQRLVGLPVIGTALKVQDRYVRDAADPLAASIAFFAFLSLFPLMLLAISLTGFVLQDPADQLAVVERLTEAIPGFEQTVQGEEGSQVAELLENVVAQRGTIGAVGLVVLLFSGLRVVNAAMVSTRVVFRGPVLLGVRKRLRQVLALIALGILALASTGASSFAGIGLGFVPSGILVLLSSGVSFVLDVGLFLAAYTFLAPSAVLSVRERLPGAVLAGAGWTALKVFGATWVGSQIASANALYGALGSVIALMLLFYLAGRLYLYGAVLSAVRYEAVHGPLVAPHESEQLDAEGNELEQLDAERNEREPGASGGTAAARGPRVQGAGIEARGPFVELDADGPPPRPRQASGVRPTDPGPRVAAATISPATRGRLAVADAVDAERGAGGRDTRTALGFALGVGALAVGWRFLGGRDR